MTFCIMQLILEMANLNLLKRGVLGSSGSYGRYPMPYITCLT
jgi:hypothetical protein